MRMMMRVNMDTEMGNQAIKSGNMAKIWGGFMERAKPEAVYFTADGGARCVYIFLDMESAAEMPALAEDFFGQLGAEVDFQPVMNPEELMEGLQAYAALSK